MVVGCGVVGYVNVGRRGSRDNQLFGVMTIYKQN